MKKKARNIFRIVLFTSTIISMFYVPWILVWAWILPLPNTIQDQVNETIKHGFDGMIVYVDQAGKAPKFYTGGYHNKVQKTPANPNALFKIASISKLYVAVAITKLVKAQRLDLNKPLVYYFPELIDRIEYADKITVKHMVQHRSGIPNFTNYPGYWSNPPENAEETLNIVLDLPASFKPDEDYEYSNTNYLLLSQLIDQVLGYSHQQYIKDEILNPLNLKNTFFSIKEVNLDDVMSGYHVGYEPDLKTEDQGMLATAQDVGIFLRALNDGTVFNAGEQDIYTSIYEYNHGGLVPGYQSLAEYYKDIDTVVIQFTNTTNFEGYNWNLSQISIGRIEKILRKQHQE